MIHCQYILVLNNIKDIFLKKYTHIGYLTGRHTDFYPNTISST